VGGHYGLTASMQSHPQSALGPTEGLYLTPGYWVRLPHATYHMPYATCHMPHATCHMPHATCHLPHATCHMPPTTCHMPHATCHMPPTTCHLSLATYHLPPAIYHTPLLSCGVLRRSHISVAAVESEALCFLPHTTTPTSHRRVCLRLKLDSVCVPRRREGKLQLSSGTHHLIRVTSHTTRVHTIQHGSRPNFAIVGLLGFRQLLLK
jgi:hypothetical protein